jgi:hypothetical protein
MQWSPLRLVYPFTWTATISGVHLDFLKDSKTSMAVTLPINKARLRSSVVWTGLRSIRWTYSAHGAPIRLTFTTNFVYFMRSLHIPCKGHASGKSAAGSSFSAGSHLIDLESLDVFSLEALGAFDHRELYGLAFLQTAKSVCLNR